MTGTGRRQHDPSGERPDGIKQQKGGQPGHQPGNSRPASYVVVICASDWAKDRIPAAAANLWDALHAGEDRTRAPEPEPDLEAEP